VEPDAFTLMSPPIEMLASEPVSAEAEISSTWA
jgi:hypothetical protein